VQVSRSGPHALLELLRIVLELQGLRDDGVAQPADLGELILAPGGFRLPGRVINQQNEFARRHAGPTGQPAADHQHRTPFRVGPRQHSPHGTVIARGFVPLHLQPAIERGLEQGVRRSSRHTRNGPVGERDVAAVVNHHRPAAQGFHPVSEPARGHVRRVIHRTGFYGRALRFPNRGVCWVFRSFRRQPMMRF
jgi:hypothetical protein